MSCVVFGVGVSPERVDGWRALDMNLPRYVHLFHLCGIRDMMDGGGVCRLVDCHVALPWGEMYGSTLPCFRTDGTNRRDLLLLLLFPRFLGQMVVSVCSCGGRCAIHAGYKS